MIVTLRATALVLLMAAGCATFDPKHPLVGEPAIQPGQFGYWIWISDGTWHLRMIAGGRSRRFQGSMVGVNGSVAEIQLTRPTLKNRMALVGDAVQFDVDLTAGSAADGFDAKVVGGCARFDLLIDGQYKSEQVRLGPRRMTARRVPFERCP